MELYNELRENWERLYWDEGYTKKLAQDHANYESAEDDDGDFSPYRFSFIFFFSFPAKACSFCLEKMLLLNFAFICMSLMTEVVVLLKNYSNKYLLTILFKSFFR